MARSKIDLRNPIFHDDNAAREYLEAALWPQGPVCPRCGVMGDRITKMAARAPARRLQLQGLPQAVQRDGRHGHGALAYPAVEVGAGDAPHGGEQKRHVGPSTAPHDGHQLRRRLVPLSPAPGSGG